MIVFFGNFLTIHGYNPTFLELVSDDLSDKYPVLNISNKKNKILRIFDMFIKFYKNRKAIKLVIIDTYSTNAYYFSILISMLCRIHNKPYMLVLSGGNLKYRLKTSKSFLFILNHAKNIITPSHYLFDLFKEFRDDIVYIPNFLNLDNYLYKERKTIKAKILWVRSIHKIYNPKMALLALKEIKNQYPNVYLCMVGPIKDSSINELNEIIKNNNLEQNVLFTNKLAKIEWINLSKEYDMFINTTNYDNHPVTILEAMALGLPIVSTNVGGISSLLEHNITAKLVQPNDFLDMAECILQFISNDKERIDICMAARRKIEEEFNKLHIIKHWHEIIDNSIL